MTCSLISEVSIGTCLWLFENHVFLLEVQKKRVYLLLKLNFRVQMSIGGFVSSHLLNKGAKKY